MMTLRLLALAAIPLVLAAQNYNDSVIAPGADIGSPSIGLGKKFSIHASRSVGPRALIGSLFVAGINQWKNDPGAWGRDWDGYGKRYGSSVGRNIIRETIAFGADGALKTDPRYFRSTSTKFLPRVKDCLMQVLITRKDSGERTPAFANVGSAFAAGQLSVLWLPRNDSHPGDGLVSTGVILMGDAGRNFIKEFWPDVRKKFHK